MTLSSRDRDERYQQEREKRMRHAQGLGGHVAARVASKSSRLNAMFTEDPWLETGVPVNEPVPDGGHCRLVIFGAGFAGVLAAIKCLQAAATEIDELLIIDPAGGFGGTWYYTRYPGLMCDVESYSYFPMLEETGYMPRKRYSSGKEIREYIELLAQRHNLPPRAMFQSRGKALSWTADNRWLCEIVETPKGLPEKTIEITADFVIVCPGNFAVPKVPAVRGIERFDGDMFHPARWRYDVTGGDETGTALNRLSDKRVAIIGTGATGVQCVPELAKYARELLVVQRTPAAVAWRDNKTTDKLAWTTRIAHKRGWHRERLHNMQAAVENHPLETKMTAGDGWTDFPAISAIIGSAASVRPDDTDEYFNKLRAIDDERSDRVRQRVADTVENPEMAEKLKAWYPGFCKTACFSDEYLPTFNRPNVRLVDTNGQAIEEVTTRGLIVAGREYPVDVIIWATGYGNMSIESMAGRAGMTIRGEDGSSMEDAFRKAELLTLHGVMFRHFPNLFIPQSSQAGFAISMSQRLHDQAAHIAYIIFEATRRVRPGHSAVVEPTAAACDDWADEIQKAAYMNYPSLDCTPGFLNLEGDLFKLSASQRAKSARVGKYGRGYLAYLQVLEGWRSQNRLEGLDVSQTAR